ncbi:MAG: glycosyltransferase family 39 protein [Candidatus Sungbacteria bacterium]|uniref:Glycosyltransferase family 39 protein n=1 Tax=Candidatus Sungiibacteriota bacterium TaxID=2750080 RepID=A0A933DTX8_9BACT|nr:glycosyltransferase family 39 protein [Candidatus Sungbacteria bacterium]
MVLRHPLIPWLVLIALAAAFNLVLLGRLPLEDADEATYAMVAREMSENGDYIVPRIDGAPWVDKPPLYFWLAASSAKIFGENEFSLRLPSVLAGIAAVVLTALIVRQLTQDKESALFSGLVLISLPLFLLASRNMRLDVPVSTAILAAIYCFLKGRERPGWFAGVGTAIGIGVLLKSVVGLLALPLILIFSLIYRDWRWLKNHYFWIGAALGIAIALPWHLAMEAALDGFFAHYFGFQIGRAAVNILESQITAAYVLWVFFRHGQPWSSLLIAGAAGWLAARFAGWRRGNPEIARAVWFSLAAWLFFFGFFLLPKTKLITYFIPSYPFAAIFLGALYAAILQTKSRTVFRAVGRAAIIAALILSVREAFLDTRLYVTAASADEKSIGLTLAGESAGIPIYLYEFPPDQSIQYYSRRPVRHISAASGVALAPPFNLIIPTPLIAENKWLNAFPPLYRGKSLALYRIE